MFGDMDQPRSMFRNTYHEMCVRLEAELQKKRLVLVRFSGSKVKGKEEFEKVLSNTLSEGTKYYGGRQVGYNDYSGFQQCHVENLPEGCEEVVNFHVLVRFPLTVALLPEFRQQLVRVKETCKCERAELQYVGFTPFEGPFHPLAYERNILSMGDTFGEKIINEELEDIEQLKVLSDVVKDDLAFKAKARIDPAIGRHGGMYSPEVLYRL